MKNVSVIQNFLKEKECKSIIGVIEVSVDFADKLSNRSRLTKDDPEWMNKLFSSVKSDLIAHGYKSITDEYGDEWECCGLNERVRLVKYVKGEQFHTHEDGCYERDWNERSFATLMVYLNNVPTDAGGATHFIDYGLRIQPRRGLCVIFKVDGLLHCGEKLLCGEKYLLRTDVMYRLKRAHSPDVKRTLFGLKEAAEETNNQHFWDRYYRLRTDYLNKIAKVAAVTKATAAMTAAVIKATTTTATVDSALL